MLIASISLMLMRLLQQLAPDISRVILLSIQQKLLQLLGDFYRDAISQLWRDLYPRTMRTARKVARLLNGGRNLLPMTIRDVPRNSDGSALEILLKLVTWTKLMLIFISVAILLLNQYLKII
ncbi:hypothetical protein [Circovirus-like genome DHCV-6]|uniref:Uncharacterized protein n=1 Tax=Circovirus-like genome DHCV-6 TaxID=1788455 RepID=A0A190WHP0_9VIRU|nr:hypothetical protein [Circovirus-like genome DHCV-6]AMB43010.1 hypothetical protein [Circovirus-like genome DHCV-6]